MPKNGTKFILDEEKACKLSGMNTAQIWDFLNELAQKRSLIKIKNGLYCAKGDIYDQTNVGEFVLGDLLGISWFTKSVIKWQSFEGDIEDDIIALAKLKGLGEF